MRPWQRQSIAAMTALRTCGSSTDIVRRPRQSHPQARIRPFGEKPFPVLRSLCPLQQSTLAFRSSIIRHYSLFSTILYAFSRCVKPCCAGFHAFSTVAGLLFFTIAGVRFEVVAAYPGHGHKQDPRELHPKGPNVVGVTGLEPAASWSRTKRATSCATPRRTLCKQRFIILTSNRIYCNGYFADDSVF